jgi:pimeloyl-ACP methyl ester carboxylesterase
MNERINKINGIDICTESFGDPTHPSILLIMGATCSMVYWDDEFCGQLANTGRHVIRYDNRDVGRSTTYEPRTSNYTVTDMASDAVGVLDAYNINQAHIVGLSLGGMIAQVMAINYPERVQTLTLIGTCMYGFDNNQDNLPSIDERILAHHAKGTTLDWTNQEVIIDYLVEGASLLSGSKRIFDKCVTKSFILVQIP